MRVCDLLGGDVIRLLDQEAVFIGRSQHRVYSSLQLVVWRLDTGEVSLDALRVDQEVGELVSAPTGWADRLKRALGTVSRAESAADERQRLAAIRLLAEAAKATVPHAPYTGVSWQRLLEVLDAPATGSVPVGTPEPTARDERPHSRACGLRQHEHGSACAADCPTCVAGGGWHYPVATPTEPWCEQHGRVHCPLCISRSAARAIRGRGGPSGGGHPEPVDGILTAEPTAGPRTPSGTGGSSCTE